MTRSAILVTGVGIVLALPLLWRALQRRFDPFEPIVAFCAAWGAMFVARPAATLIGGDTDYFGIDVLRTFPLVLLLALVGAVAFICGYELSLGRRLARSLPSFPTLNETRAGWVALGVAVASAVALVLAVATTVGLDDLDVLLEGRGEGLGAVLSGSSDYLWNASLLAVPAGIVLVAVALRRPTVPFVLAAVACCGLVLLRTVPAGNRISLLPFLVGVAMVVYLYRMRRPRFVTLVGVALVALFASYLLVVARYPDTRETTGDSIAWAFRDPSRIFSPITRGPDAEQALVLAGALTAIPSELPFKYGKAVVGDLLVRPVPRELWGGKPIPPIREVTAEVYPGVPPGFNFAYSTLLFFYWDFGVLGVAAGMALFGLGARLLYELLMREPGSAFAQLVYAGSFWLVIVGLRDGPVDTAVLGAFLCLPLFAMLVFASRRSQLPRGRTPGRMSFLTTKTGRAG